MQYQDAQVSLDGAGASVATSSVSDVDVNEQTLTLDSPSMPAAIESAVRVNQTAQQKRFTYMCACIACLSSILLGYDIGVMSGAVIFMKRDFHFNEIRVELILSSLNYCAAFGSFLAGDLAARIGRRYTILFASLLFFGGSLLMMFAQGFAVIMIGRIILGIATGCGLIIAPLYSAELSPPWIRGKLVSFAEISINLGILMGYVISYLLRGLGDDLAWRVMVGLGSLPALLLFVGVVVMPESPRWLLEKQRRPEASHVLSKFIPASEIDNSINDITEAIELERESVNNGRVSWFELLSPLWLINAYDGCLYWLSNGSIPIREPLSVGTMALRSALFLGIISSFCQMITGVEAVTYYTPMILEDVMSSNNNDDNTSDDDNDDDGSHDSAVFLGTIIVGFVKLSFIFVASFNLDHYGRRPLLLLSSVGMAVSLACLALTHILPFMSNSWMSVVWLCVYTASFSVGWGPVEWVLISEIFPLTVRSQAMSLCGFTNRFISGSVALSFLSLQRLITTQGSWWFYCTMAIGTFGFVWKYVPETKGRTLEEITALLIAQTGRGKLLSEVMPKNIESDVIVESSPMIEPMDRARSEVSIALSTLSVNQSGLGEMK